MEYNREYKIRVKRFKWLPRIINDYREGKTVKSFFKVHLGNVYIKCMVQLSIIMYSIPHKCDGRE